MFGEFAQFFSEGGPFIWVIIAVFAMTASVIVDRFALIFRYRVNAVALWQKVRDLVGSDRIQEALNLCRKSEAPLPRIFASGLKTANGTEQQIQNAVDEIMLEVVPELEKRVGYLTILANIATLAGLIGTIFGLRMAFSGVAVADPTQKAGILANGIATALNTTALGLMVAVTALLSYSVIQSRITGMVDDIDQFSVKLINLLVEKGNRDGTKTVS